MKQFKVGILGATGAVGREMMKILEERKFPVAELRPIASERSAGTKLPFNGGEVEVVAAADSAFEGLDLVLGRGGKRHCQAVRARHRQGRCGIRGQLQRLPSRSQGAAGHPRDQPRGREVAQRHHLQPQLHHHRHPRRHQRAGEGKPHRDHHRQLLSGGLRRGQERHRRAAR